MNEKFQQASQESEQLTVLATKQKAPKSSSVKHSILA